jgi:23S rRNA pseudouridine1911/1915/1917 synthase
VGRAKSKSSAESGDSSQTFHLAPESENQTLSAALRHWLTDRSWSQIRRLILSRYVTINGNACTDAGRRLKADDVVKVLERPAAAPPEEHDIQVQYLDQYLIVVEKPAGVTSNRHREERDWPKRRKQIQPTLDEMLPHIIAKIEGRRGKGVPPPVRAVHRLDRETSGLMVFARTHAAERILAQQFRQHATHRRYLAVVEGRVAAQTIRTRLIRDRGDGRRGSTERAGVGKEAITYVKPLETIPGYTLIQCKLETGRTHQIRIHVSEQGHPVCGEKVYGRRPGAAGSASVSLPSPLAGDWPGVRGSPAPRLALHAAELGFLHPITGKPLRFQSPLPNELANFWRHLKQE